MILIEILYILSATLLAVYGYNSLILGLIRKWRYKPFSVLQPREDFDWPHVTVQLPIYNERYVVERLIEAVGSLDYPRDRLQVQVLDDSTDDTREIVDRAVIVQRARGLDIEAVRRPDRQGFKGGALGYGLRQARGEFIAIFDADFLPSPDFLKKSIPYFSQGTQIGCVQTRWGHVNRLSSWLTRSQAAGIDGHFVVEQEMRSASRLFLNFNGTAGVWRRLCIEDAGGWHSDTLTEDLDLSYRAQLRDWQILYLPHITAPAELPTFVTAYKRQQFRWAKGSIQTARKLLGALWRSRYPLLTKIQGSIHLTNYAVHPLMLLNLLLTLPIIHAGNRLMWVLPIFTGAALGPLLMYWVTMTEEGKTPLEWIVHLFMLVTLGMGLSLNNSIAVSEAVLGKRSSFMRTPKFNLRDREGRVGYSEYVLPRDPGVWAELLLSIYTSGLLVYVLLLGVWGLVPWLSLYAGGYSYITVLNFIQARQNPKRLSSRAELPREQETRGDFVWRGALQPPSRHSLSTIIPAESRPRSSPPARG